MPHHGQIPEVKGSEFNDRDRLNDILSFEKYLTVGYNISVNEANNDLLYHDLLQILNDTHQNQRQLYKLMFNKGWYKETVADQQEINQTATQFTNYQTQLPYGNQQYTKTIPQAGQQYWTGEQQFTQTGPQFWPGQQYAPPMPQQPSQQYQSPPAGQQMPQFAPIGPQQWQTMPQYGPTTPHLGQHQPSPWRRV
ncbi:MAG: spore coat protein [Firmicutes bacterium]|nr:spore coat protein [Bacillota bacterium]